MIGCTQYDVKSGSTFCCVCKTAVTQIKLLQELKKDHAFISRGVVDWKEATTAFLKHQCKEAIEALIHLPKQILGNIAEMLNRAEKPNNRKMFLLILRSIRYLARQGIPLRGHSGDVDA